MWTSWNFCDHVNDVIGAVMKGRADWAVDRDSIGSMFFSAAGWVLETLETNHCCLCRGCLVGFHMFFRCFLLWGAACWWPFGSELGAKVGRMNWMLQLWFLFCCGHFVIIFLAMIFAPSLSLSLCCLAVPYSAMWEVVHPWTIDDEAANETWQHQQCCCHVHLGRSMIKFSCTFQYFAWWHMMTQKTPAGVELLFSARAVDKVC